ncbi:MAG: methionine biosynthesis protein MetW [Bryobacteraceae bacterium]
MVRGQPKPIVETLFPRDIAEFVRAGEEFRNRLSGVKASTQLADYGWYPYESLTALPVLADLMADHYDDLRQACCAGAVADLGCGDGDLAMMLARFGARVDAMDHREANFNQMRGVEALRKTLCPEVCIHDIDLDGAFHLPRADYGLVLFLGTLYHLRNPFYVLQELAKASDWCILSTRIAQVTPGARTRIETEPLAYLLAAREANNDPTNFWVFSPAGLVRLVDRAGWLVLGQKRLGCAVDSDPVGDAADERMFVLLKSRTRHPELQVRPLEGWHAPEEDRWCWTAKRFSLEAVLPAESRSTEFALRFTVPAEAVVSSGGEVGLSCRIDGKPAGSISCTAPETLEFRGRFPESIATGARVVLEFSVKSSFAPADDGRELGVVVPLLDASSRGTHRIPFRIS